MDDLNLPMATFTLPEIYKLTSSGKIQTWFGICVDSVIYVRTGYQGMKQTWTAGKVCIPKNKGKANETTGRQQAEAELTSMRTKKLERDSYVEDIANISKDTRVFPMLAHVYKDHPSKVKYPCAVQIKYDGLCCMVEMEFKPTHGHALDSINLVARSRTHKAFPQHIQNLIWSSGVLENIVLFGSFNDKVYLHGELYSNDIDFQKIVHLIKSTSLSSQELALLNTHLKFHWYDFYITDRPSDSYGTRYGLMKTLVSNNPSDTIHLVDTYVLQDESKFKETHDLFVSQGYEGLMIRNLDSVYQPGERSYDLLKYKEFDDAEFEIVGYDTGEGKEEGCVIFLCKTEDDKTFRVRPRGCLGDRRKMYSDCENSLEDSDFMYKGKMYTVRYFGWTNECIPRMPVGIGIRDE